MEGSAQVRLVFAGELLSGFSLDEVKRAFGRAFQLEGDRLENVFAGGRTVLKRSLGHDDADRYVQRLRKMGMQVQVEPMDGLPTPKPTAVPAPAPAPVAPATPALSLLEEQVTCPNCGERQSMRTLCRNCATDIPRAQANKQEELDRARAERLAARNGGRFAPPKSDVGGTGFEPTDELPPLWSLSFEGRMGRLAYFNAGMLSMVGIALAGIGAAIVMPAFGSMGVLVPFVLMFVVFLVWAMRVSALRLHDLNRSGWWSLALLVPYAGNVGSLVMMFWSGTEGDNDYGPQPRQGNGAVAMAMAVLMALVLVGSMFSYRSYTKRVRAAQTPAVEQFDPAAEQATDRIAGPAALKAFTEEYLGQANHKAFAASDSGAFGWRSGQSSLREAATQAMAACEADRKAYTGPCKLVNVNGQWVKLR